MKKLLLSFAALLFGLSAFAQSSEQISAILKSEKANCGQASYLAATYTNSISDTDSEKAACEALKNAGYLPEGISADQEINLAQLSYLFTKALGIKGGLFYTLIPSPRYAYKELKARGVLPAESDPSMKISGRDCLDLFNSCLEFAENKGAE
ncbi:MAG: hypothetical protein II821_01550 [Treponema sp.]|nr:hypothetical protein [Treponema sp.]